MKRKLLLVASVAIIIVAVFLIFRNNRQVEKIKAPTGRTIAKDLKELSRGETMPLAFLVRSAGETLTVYGDQEVNSTSKDLKHQQPYPTRPFKNLYYIEAIHQDTFRIDMKAGLIECLSSKGYRFRNYEKGISHGIVFNHQLYFDYYRFNPNRTFESFVLKWTPDTDQIDTVLRVTDTFKDVFKNLDPRCMINAVDGQFFRTSKGVGFVFCMTSNGFFINAAGETKTFQTIDKVGLAKLNVINIDYGDTKASMCSDEEAITRNLDVCSDDQFIYVLSGIGMKKDKALIDVYDVSTLQYQRSLSIPVIDTDTYPTSIAKDDEYFYILSFNGKIQKLQ